MENLHTPKLLTRCINLPEDLLYYILIFLDIDKIEELGFNFKPSEFNKNIQNPIKLIIQAQINHINSKTHGKQQKQ